MVPSITHRHAAHGTLNSIKPACESWVRGDERPVPTTNYTSEQWLELFDQASAVAEFFATIIKRGSRNFDFNDREAYTLSRRYARNLAHMLTERHELDPKDRSRLFDWLDADQRMPEIGITYDSRGQAARKVRT